MYLVNCD